MSFNGAFCQERLAALVLAFDHPGVPLQVFLQESLNATAFRTLDRLHLISVGTLQVPMILPTSMCQSQATCTSSHPQLLCYKPLKPTT